MIRILSPGVSEFDNCICISCIDSSYGVLSIAVSTAFKLLGMEADVDIERDMSKICKEYFTKAV